MIFGQPDTVLQTNLIKRRNSGDLRYPMPSRRNLCYSYPKPQCHLFHLIMDVIQSSQTFASNCPDSATHQVNQGTPLRSEKRTTQGHTCDLSAVLLYENPSFVAFEPLSMKLSSLFPLLIFRRVRHSFSVPGYSHSRYTSGAMA